MKSTKYFSNGKNSLAKETILCYDKTIVKGKGVDTLINSFDDLIAASQAMMDILLDHHWQTSEEQTLFWGERSIPSETAKRESTPGENCAPFSR